jgi:hypothetical protein
MMVLVAAHDPEDAKTRASLFMTGGLSTTYHIKTAVVALDLLGIQGLHLTHVWIDEILEGGHT